jgi:hypothetical protein
MKRTSKASITWLVAALLIAGSALARKQATQQSGDQNQSGSSTANNSKKKADSDASSSQAPDSNAAASKQKNASKPAPAAPANTSGSGAPATKAAAGPHSPPANAAGTVWVNTDSGIYHKPGSRWYGKTKRGKYMTEADAVKAGYREAKKKK